MSQEQERPRAAERCPQEHPQAAKRCELALGHVGFHQAQLASGRLTWETPADSRAR